MWSIIGLSLVGFIVSVMILYRGCLCDCEKEDWAVLGLIIYVVLIATIALPIMTKCFAVGIAVVTLGLIIMSLLRRQLCVMCVLSWLVNISILFIAFNR